MIERFSFQEVLPGVYHIQDAMGVHCTLLVGREEALLFDTGYGLYDVRAAVTEITPLPVHVLLSHGHHDHACGAVWFDQAWIHPADAALLAGYLGKESRERVLKQARARNALGAGYDELAYATMGAGNIQPVPDYAMDLGSMEVRVLPVPGHSAGSLCAYVPSRRLLLTGDNWNPTTWLFFRESASVRQYAQCMRAMDLSGVDYALASHEGSLVPGERLRQHVMGLTEEAFRQAQPDDVGRHYGIRTMSCHPEPGTALIFDADRYTD